MKHFGFCICFLFVCLSCLGQSYQTLFIFNTAQGDTVHYILESKKTYSDSHLLLEEELFKLKHKIVYRYTDSLLTSAETTSEGKEIEHTIYRYNKNHLLISKTSKTGTLVNDSNIFYYNKKGWLMKEVDISQQSPAIKTRYQYDKKGRVISETEWTYQQKRKKRQKDEKKPCDHRERLL